MNGHEHDEPPGDSEEGGRNDEENAEAFHEATTRVMDRGRRAADPADLAKGNTGVLDPNAVNRRGLPFSKLRGRRQGERRSANSVWSKEPSIDRDALPSALAPSSGRESPPPSPAAPARGNAVWIVTLLLLALVAGFLGVLLLAGL